MHPGAPANAQGRANLVALLKTLVRRRGMHVQFNVVDNETFRKAQAHPEQYTDLVARVSGYSAYWTDLGAPIQEDILRRTSFLQF